MPGLSGTVEAFQRGAEIGQLRRERKQQRTDQLEDEQRQLRVADLYDKGHALAKTIPSLKGTPDYGKAMSQLADIESNIKDIYHPQKNPGAVQRDWEFLRGLITRKKQPAPLNVNYDATTTPDRTFTPPDQSVTLGATPSYQTPEALKAGAKLRTEQGTPEGSVTLPSGPVTIPGSTYNVRPAASIMTPQQRQQMTQRDAARKQAELDVTAAGLSPEQQERIDAQKTMADVEAKLAIIEKLPGINWTPGERERVKQSLLYAALGAKEPQAKYFSQIITTKDANGVEHHYRVPMQEDAEPEEVLVGQKIAPKGPAKGLKYDSVTGQVVDQDTTKRYSLDDVGKPGTPPEVLAIFNGAKAMMDKKQQNALALANQRGLSLAQNRYGSFIDPANPTEVIAVPFGEAAKRGLHLAMGPKYQAMVGTLKAGTYGPIGNEIVAFSTALQHADLLEQAAQNMHNPDVRVLARISNDLLTQFGDESPTDFGVIANAYTREVTKALTSGHVTDNELRENGATIPRDASPEQIMGAITQYRKLMQSKINIRVEQINAGMAGTPYLGTSPTAPGGSMPQPKKTYRHYATNAQKHRIGTDDDPHSPNAKWYDVETGNAVQP